MRRASLRCSPGRFSVRCSPIADRATLLPRKVFLAERGAGPLESPPVLLSRNERVDRMFWA